MIYSFSNVDEIKEELNNRIVKLEKETKTLISSIDGDITITHRSNLRKKLHTKTVELETFRLCLKMLEGLQL